MRHDDTLGARRRTDPGQRRPVGSFSNRLAGAEDGVFTERRLRLYGIGIVGALAAVVGSKIAHGASVVDAAGRPACIDFCTTWVSGKFAASAHPVRIYDYVRFSAAQMQLVGPHHANLPAYHFWYPPTFLLLTWPLGHLSYVAAFAVWNLVTLLLYAAAVYAIVPRPVAVVAALVPIVVAENFLLGQTGFLTAAMIGFSLVLLEQRPRLAGAVVGLLTYKPPFGVLFPLTLIAARNWRGLVSATVTSLLLGMAAAAAFGIAGWLFFLDTFRGRTSSLGLDPGLELTLQSVYGLLHWTGARGGIAWTAHLTVAAIVTATIWALWSRPVPYSLQAAALCLGAVIVTPYVQIYDLCILPIAVAFIVRDGLSRGFLPGERTVVVFALAGLFLLLKPLGAMIAMVLFGLVLRRVAAARRDPAMPFGARAPGRP